MRGAVCANSALEAKSAVRGGSTVRLEVLLLT